MLAHLLAAGIFTATPVSLISGEMTAQEIVTYAMYEFGVISAGEQPTAEEAEFGRQRLNWLLKSWQAKGSNLWRETQGEATFDTGVATVTLDPFVVDVSDARLVQSSTFERPLQRWENGEYRQIPNKATPGFPTAFYINKQRSAVTMTLWPVPSQSITVLYTYARVIEDVTDLAQIIDVPQQWTETVWMCLAARLISAFGVSRIDPASSQLIIQRAAQLEQEMLDSDRPASIFMGNVYGRNF